MNRLALILMLLASAVAVRGQRPVEQAGATPAVRFAPIDIYIDAGQRPLAVYQFELTVAAGDAKIVGVEGGDHPAFREPPHYDPAALMKGRIIVGAFSTDQQLPAGRTRVARLHMRIAGDAPPDYAIDLTAAASADEQRLPATISIIEGEGS